MSLLSRTLQYDFKAVGKDLEREHYNAMYVKFLVQISVLGVQGRTSRESLWLETQERLSRTNFISGRGQREDVLGKGRRGK